MKSLLKLSATALCLALAACTTPLTAPITSKVEATAQDVNALMIQAQRGAGPVQQQRASSVEFISGVYIPTSKLPDANVKVMAKDSANRRYTINRELKTIQEAAERIMSKTGIPVIIAPDAVNAGKKTEQSGIAVPQAMNPAIPTPLPLPNSANSPAGYYANSGLNASGPSMQFTYDGPLAGFLDIVAARFGISWEWSGTNVNFFKKMTRTFPIVGIPGDTTLNNTISSSTGTTSSSGGASSSGSGGATGSNSSGGSNSTAGMSVSGMSVWNDIRDTLEKMKSPEGSVSVTPATGSATVTDTPEMLTRMEAFITAQNALLSKQVTVNVRVLSVDLNDGGEYGINWNLMHKTLSNNFNWGIANNFAASASSSSLALRVLSAAAGGGNANLASWQGSEAIISALKTQGHVSQITSASLPTSNMQPAPLRVGTQQSYLQSSATTQTANVGSTSTLTPGLITTGFSMSVIPNIGEKGKLMLQYAINISSLLDINKITSGGSTIETPLIDTRDFLQRVILSSGDTIVVAGFEQSALNSKSQGVGSASNIMLGGGANASKKRSVLVILIQPIIGES